MKSLLPLLVVAAAHAQTAPVKATDSNFSFTAGNYMIAHDAEDFEGMSYGFKAKIWDEVRMTLSFADTTSDPFDLVSGVNVEAGARRVALGAEYDVHTDFGNVTLSFAFGQTAGRTKGGFVGDAFQNQQFVFGASYAKDLGKGFALTVAANKFISDFDVDANFSTAAARTALAERFDGSPFSVGLTLSYAPTDKVSIYLSYATEDSLLGLGNVDNTISFGLSARF
jgi:hypothetical protein